MSMKPWIIAGKDDSEFRELTFGFFTTKKLAKQGFKQLPKEFQEVTEILQSNLAMNTVQVDDKVIDLAAKRPGFEAELKSKLSLLDLANACTTIAELAIPIEDPECRRDWQEAIEKLDKLRKVALKYSKETEEE